MNESNIDVPPKEMRVIIDTSDDSPLSICAAEGKIELQDGSTFRVTAYLPRDMTEQAFTWLVTALEHLGENIDWETKAVK